MVSLDCTLLNFSHKDFFSSVFEGYGNEFEYTSNGVFRRSERPICPECSTRMNHNGYNTYTKQGLGSVRIGRYVCPFCRCSFEEERGFWESLKNDFFTVLNRLFQVLRVNHVSFRGISDVMDLIFPRGKDTIMNVFNESVEKIIVPPIEDVHIVHYDEQFPKRGRTTEYRLTLLDHETARSIAEELSSKKDPKTIKNFLSRHLNPEQKTFVVADLYSSNRQVFEEFFGENLIFQYCLLHLNKRIVNDFPKNTTLKQELTKYKLLNIFYDRDAEIQFLKEIIKANPEHTDQPKKWHKTKLKPFKKFLYKRKLTRRRNKLNHKQRTYLDACTKINQLMAEIDTFDKKVRKRLRKIDKNWKYFTNFYFTPSAPATNNLIENHYSTSLKTHQKKH
ncbi:ISNCY family transposase [Methanobacterium petrolearium]|uniref:ISNCY family transposase n=1 Tax=Methanobacterium petrolearium TaxID=710190 RepID=UPI003081BEBC